jgi:hypothetical protein
MGQALKKKGGVLFLVLARSPFSNVLLNSAPIVSSLVGLGNIDKLCQFFRRKKSQHVSWLGLFWEGMFLKNY